MHSQITARLSVFIKQHFFKQYLVLQHGLHIAPGDTASRPARYVRALRGLFTYPLAHADAMRHCTPLTHPQPLKTRAQVEDSVRRVLALGLKPHKALEKNWDFLHAFSLILARGRQEDAVIDMGVGDTASVILRWLAVYGYRHLYGCDQYVAPHSEGPIQYTTQNIEMTTYPDASADVITCLSVIEHGVHMGHFLAECKRVLKPGGLLVISTDFWCEPLDLEGVEDELGPVHVFSPDEIQRDILDTATQNGLRALGEPDFTCGDPVVNRAHIPALHRRYTFYCMSFEREA